MKTEHSIILRSLAWLAAFFLGVLAGRQFAERPLCAEAETRETHLDTITSRRPVALESEFTGFDTFRIAMPAKLSFAEERGHSKPIAEARGPGQKRRFDSGATAGATAGNTCREEARVIAGASILDGRDSAVVELPIIRRHYADSTYEAWVSGPIDPRLDSIRVYARTTTITKREWKPPKRWHLGVTAGYGYGAKGFQPYIGIGITYSIFSF